MAPLPPPPNPCPNPNHATRCNFFFFHPSPSPRPAVFDLLERKRQVPQARWRKRLARVLQSGPLLGASLLLTILVGAWELHALLPSCLDALLFTILAGACGLFCSAELP